MNKVQLVDMKRKEERKHNSPSGNILKLTYHLLIVCGQTLSTDGFTISRRMVIYSGAIYVVNLILIFKNVLCFDKEDDFDSWEVAENLCSVIYQIALQIAITIFLYVSVKKFPTFIKKLEKLEQAIRDESLQRQIQLSLKRINIIGLISSSIFTIGLTLFTFLMGTNTLENCPKHMWFFRTKDQHYYVIRFINVFTVYPGFQLLAGLTFLVSVCQVVTMYFKYLEKQLSMTDEFDMDMESMESTVQESRCSVEQIRRIRILYEHVCHLTVKLDEGINVILGIPLSFMTPMICLIAYNAFVPEFRSDLLFYGLFGLFYCLVIQVVTANLNSQVTFHLHFSKSMINIT